MKYVWYGFLGLFSLGFLGLIAGIAGVIYIFSYYGQGLAGLLPAQGLQAADRHTALCRGWPVERRVRAGKACLRAD